MKRTTIQGTGPFSRQECSGYGRARGCPWLPLLVAAAVLVPLGCGEKPSPNVLARVGPNEIRVEQFRDQWVRRSGGRPEAVDKAALLQEMVEQEALYLRALHAGLNRDPELERAWRTLLIAKLKERELAPKLAEAQVTPEELRHAYEAERERLTRPAAVKLAVLYLKTDAVMRPDKIAELRQRLEQARQSALAPGASAGAGFGSLAISCSDDQASRYTGGILGWIEPNRGHAWLGPAAIEAGFALKIPGEISPVIADANGLCVLKLVERRDSTVIPLEKAENALRQQVLAEKRRRIEQAFVRDACASVTVQMHPELLPGLRPPAPSAVAEHRQPPAFP